MERRSGERRLISHVQLQCNRQYRSQSRSSRRRDLRGDGEHDEAGRRSPPSLRCRPQSLEDNCAQKIVETTQYHPDVSKEEGVSENGGLLLKKAIVKKRVEQCKRP
ncbi:PREDICTED: uncharacterized protein LOC101295151 [Fragaria vesca subsp. vesca]